MSAKLALSIRQPWAWLILHAGKDIENRNWPTKFRGEIYIHASKGMTRDEYEEADYTLRGAHESLDLPPFAKLDRGGIVGTVEIVDCVSDHNSDWFFGDFGLVLRNPKPLAFIPCKGKLGFFRPDLPGEDGGAA